MLITYCWKAAQRMKSVACTEPDAIIMPLWWGHGRISAAPLMLAQVFLFCQSKPSDLRAGRKCCITVYEKEGKLSVRYLKWHLRFRETNEIRKNPFSCRVNKKNNFSGHFVFRKYKSRYQLLHQLRASPPPSSCCVAGTIMACVQNCCALSNAQLQISVGPPGN